MTNRPAALWVPDLLRIMPRSSLSEAGSRAEIRLGLEASAWDGAADITRFEGHLVFAATADLNAAHRRDLGFDAAIESLRNHPRLRQIAEQMPLTLVPAERVEELRGTGVRLFEVGANPGNRRFAFAAERNQSVLAEIEGPLDFDENSPDILDRLLRAASQGLVDAHSVELARFIAELKDQPLASIEAGLGEIEVRADRGLASVLRERLRDAAGDRVDLPVYGIASREFWPEVKLEGLEDQLGLHVHCERADGSIATSLTIPAEVRWFVEEVEPWMPPSWAEAARHLERARRSERRHDRFSRIFRMVALLLGVLWVVWSLSE